MPNPAPPRIHALTPTLSVVELPLPLRLKSVNAYVGRDDDGAVTIIDTGLGINTRDTWSAAFALMGITPGDVRRIIVTHFHPDHVGGSADLAALTGAAVYVTATTAQMAQLTWADGRSAMFADIAEDMLRHGLSRERIQLLGREAPGIEQFVRIPDTFLPIHPGEELSFASATWEVIEMPGHADGHACLLDRAGERLISGDHLLEVISPAIGLYPHSRPDPLADYYASLRATALLPVSTVLPGHGTPFRDAAARCGALIAHHDNRLSACSDAVAAGARSTMDVALHVFGTQADISNEQFAIAEAAAHLEYLRRTTRVRRTYGDDGTLLWEPTV